MDFKAIYKRLCLDLKNQKQQLLKVTFIFIIIFLLKDFVYSVFDFIHLQIAKHLAINTINSILIALLVLTIISVKLYNIFKHRNKTNNSLVLSYIVIFFLFLFLIYLFQTPNSLYEFHLKLKGLFYLNFFIITLLFYPIEYLINVLSSKNVENEDKGLSYNTPAEDIEKEDDFLQRKFIVKNISNKIFDLNSKKEAFTIGIEANWGVGKTSLFNFIKKELENEVYTIDLNVWKNYDQNINEFFFKELRAEFPSLKRSIKQYLNALNLASKKVLNVDINFLNNSSVSKEFESLKNQINNLDKKVVVFLDDIDRLYSNEILELFRLIRNTANFGNLVYVLGYEKAYLLDILEKNNIPFPERYMEKIICHEFNLPKIKTTNIREYFFRRIKKKLNKKDYEILNKPDESQGIIFSNTKEICFDSLDNLRDVIRLCNAFIFDFEKFNGNIDIFDLVNINILKLKHHIVYKEIFYNDKNEIINKPQNFYDNKNEIEYKALKESDEYVKNNKLDKSFVDINRILSEIFPIKIEDEQNNLPLFNHNNNKNIKFGKISKLENYNFYIHFEISILDENHFKELRKETDTNEFIEKNKTWLNKEEKTKEQKTTVLLTRIEAIINTTSYNSLQDLKNIFWLLTELTFEETRKYPYIIQKLLNITTLKKFFEKEDNARQEQDSILKELIQKAKHPFFYESIIINELRKEGENQLYNDKLRNYNLKLFKKYIKHSNSNFIIDNKRNHYVYAHYHRCTKYDSIKLNYFYDEDQNSIFKSFVINKGVFNFLITVIDLDNGLYVRDEEENHYRINDIILNIFRDKTEDKTEEIISNFEEFIKYSTTEEERENPKFKEILSFIKVWKENKYNWTKYNFNEILIYFIKPE